MARRVEAQNLVIEAVEPRLALCRSQRLDAAAPIAGPQCRPASMVKSSDHAGGWPIAARSPFCAKMIAQFRPMAMGLENVFFSARPIVELLARSTICSSTTFFSNSRKVQRARPLGGLEQASAINLVPFSPQNPCNRRCRPLLAAQHSLEAFFHELLPDPVNHRCAALIIRLSLQPSPASDTSAFNNIRAFSSRCAALLPLRISASSCSRSSPLSRNILLYRNVLNSHDCLRRIRCDQSESKNSCPCKLFEASD